MQKLFGCGVYYLRVARRGVPVDVSHTVLRHCGNKLFRQIKASPREAVCRRVSARNAFNYLVAFVYIFNQTFGRRINFVVSVRVGMDAQRVPLTVNSFQKIFSGLGLNTYNKKRGFDVFFGKDVQYFRRYPVAGSVVEGEINRLNCDVLVVGVRKLSFIDYNAAECGYGQRKGKHCRAKCGEISVHIRILRKFTNFTYVF